MADYWFAYECLNNICSSTVLDLRIEIMGEVVPPQIQCPLCKNNLYFRGYWKATDGGWGSEADGVNNVLHHARNVVEQPTNSQQIQLLTEAFAAFDAALSLNQN